MLHIGNSEFLHPEKPMKHKIGDVSEFKRRFNEFSLERGEFERHCTICFYENLQLLITAAGGLRRWAATYSVWLNTAYDGSALENLSAEVIENSTAYRYILDARAYGVFGLDEFSDHIYEEPLEGSDISVAIVVYRQIAEICKDPEFSGIVAAAEARHAIDGSADAPIDVTGLAILAGLSVKSVRNALTPSSGSGLELIRSGEDKGKVPCTSARRWLLEQSGYRPTLLVQQKDLQETLIIDEIIEIGSLIFVPETVDGHAFGTSSQIEGEYRVGARGSEQSVPDFFTALSLLQTMPVPVWQMQGKEGGTKYATGAHWVRISKSRLTDVKGE